jgi:small subunit ribosomal protein S20
VKRTKSGKKRVRSDKKRKARNIQAKSEIKKVFKAAEKALIAKSTEVKELVIKAVSVIDKAVERGIVHRNKAARKKSRLMRKLEA